MNTLTRAFADRLWTQQFNWLTATLRVRLVDVDYVFDPENPTAPIAPIATSDILTGLTVEDGWAKADPAWFATVADGREIVGAVLTPTLETLPIILIDTAVGLPANAPGAPFWLAWQNEGIVRL